MNSTYMECTTGTSNKFYEVELKNSGRSYTVQGTYGRIGTTGAKGRLYTYRYRSLAMSRYDRIVESKLSKGYEIRPKKGKTKKKKTTKSLDRFSLILRE